MSTSGCSSARRSGPTISIGTPRDLAHRLPVAELVEPVGRRRQADAAAGVPVDGLAGLGLELRVQLDAVAQ